MAFTHSAAPGGERPIGVYWSRLLLRHAWGYVLLSLRLSKIVLFQDRIEVVELTRTKVLSRRDIRGWKSVSASPPAFVLVPKGGQPRVGVAQIFPVDAEFNEWLYTLPYLGSEDARAAKARIRNDARRSATHGKRMKSGAKGRQTRP